MVVLGIELDTAELVARLPADKLEVACLLLRVGPQESGVIVTSRSR